MKYTSLAIDNPRNLLFGSAPHPVATRAGMLIGGGLVYPELNFTLPAILVDKAHMPEISRHYRQIITGALARAAQLEADGVVIEFETLPPMTEFPDLGMEIVNILLEGMEQERAKSGLRSVLRVTPNDNREFDRPPILRRGRYLNAMLDLFDRSAAAGAELLSIESVGGKEIHDDALLNGDLAGSIFALCILGARDMRFLWTEIAGIAKKRGALPAGDTACGFGNTAMVLAEKQMIPKVFAATVRAVTAVRSLVAYECGAVGPGKDCGYENAILKAITGCPMAMEGKTAACAHLSPMGNLAAAACDTWSNESVQNIKLLGDMAPTCYMEQLIYDCRLMNEARRDGDDAARTLQTWMVRSDAPRDPQAFIIAPATAIEIARAIVSSKSHYEAGRNAARKALELMRAAHEGGSLQVPANETGWFDTLNEALDDMPGDEGGFIAQQLALADTTRFTPSEYGLD